MNEHKTQTVCAGDVELETELSNPDDTNLLNNPEKLCKRLEEQGILIFRNFFDPNEVIFLRIRKQVNSKFFVCVSYQDDRIAKNYYQFLKTMAHRRIFQKF